MFINNKNTIKLDEYERNSNIDVNQTFTWHLCFSKSETSTYSIIQSKQRSLFLCDGDETLLSSCIELNSFDELNIHLDDSNRMNSVLLPVILYIVLRPIKNALTKTLAVFIQTSSVFMVTVPNSLRKAIQLLLFSLSNTAKTTCRNDPDLYSSFSKHVLFFSNDENEHYC